VIEPRRIATDDEAAAATEVLAQAFYTDPTWSWAFPDPERRHDQLHALWSLYVRSARSYSWAWITGDSSAAAIWIPPGRPELTPEQEIEMEQLIVDLLGDDAGRVLDAVAQFDSAHPHDEPHFYLSLLGTDPAQRGKGLGLDLLSSTLWHVDSERMPAYLESTNPANVPLYERFGFEVCGRFNIADGPTVTTMWRLPHVPLIR
jgi:ribosomal protein S18 acetylase RimI-like enzyme